MGFSRHTKLTFFQTQNFTLLSNVHEIRQRSTRIIMKNNNNLLLTVNVLKTKTQHTGRHKMHLKFESQET